MEKPNETKKPSLPTIKPHSPDLFGLTCPITCLPMIDPVMTVDGWSFERAAIKKWFDQGKYSNPITKKLLPLMTGKSHPELITNYSLKDAIADLITKFQQLNIKPNEAEQVWLDNELRIFQLKKTILKQICNDYMEYKKKVDSKKLSSTTSTLLAIGPHSLSPLPEQKENLQPTEISHTLNKEALLNQSLEYFHLFQYEKALPILLQLAKSSTLEPYQLLKKIYEQPGFGIAKDPTKVYLYQTLIQKNQNSRILPSTSKEALYLDSLCNDNITSLLAAADKDYPPAIVRLGQRYMAKGNHHTAISYFKEAANLYRYPAAYYEIARCYEYALGMTKDIFAAKEFYRLAADHGHIEALCALGRLHESSFIDKFENHPIDIKAAQKYYQQAAELGSAKGQGAMGKISFNVQLQGMHAMYWHIQGAAQGELQCQYILACLYVLLPPLYKYANHAHYWTLQSAIQGHTLSIMQIAKDYECGIGVEKDLSKTIRLLKAILANNSSDADSIRLKHEANKELKKLYQQKENNEILDSTSADWEFIKEENVTSPDLLLLGNIKSTNLQTMASYLENSPDWANCPITKEQIKSPATTVHGQSFEDDKIKQWVSDNKSCPLTRKPLSTQQLIFNEFLYKAIKLLNFVTTLKQQALILNILETTSSKPKSIPGMLTKEPTETSSNYVEKKKVFSTPSTIITSSISQQKKQEVSEDVTVASKLSYPL